MGWASGGGLFSSIIGELQDVIDDKETRKKVYKSLIKEFEAYDCDTLDECQGEDDAFDEVFREIYGLDEEDDD